jgi:hypothetical protein
LQLTKHEIFAVKYIKETQKCGSLCIFAAFYGLLYIWRKVAISSDLFLEIQAVPRRVLIGFSPYLSPDIGPTARPYGPIWDRRDGRKQVSTSNLAFYCGTPERDNFDIIQHKKSSRIGLFPRYSAPAVSASFLLSYCLRTRAAWIPSFLTCSVNPQHSSLVKSMPRSSIHVESAFTAIQLVNAFDASYLAYYPWFII